MQLKHKRRLIIILGITLILLLYLAKGLSFLIKLIAILFGVLIFNYIDHSFKLRFPKRYYFYVLIIITFGVLLSPLYYVSTYYDKVLHFTMPILVGSIVFFIVKKLDISLKWKFLLTAACVLSSFVILEIGEYIFDIFLGMKLQGVYLRDYTGLIKYTPIQSRIDDTMYDLIFGLFGILTFTIAKSLQLKFKLFNKKN